MNKEKLRLEIFMEKRGADIAVARKLIEKKDYHGKKIFRFNDEQNYALLVISEYISWVDKSNQQLNSTDPIYKSRVELIDEIHHMMNKYRMDFQLLRKLCLEKLLDEEKYIEAVIVTYMKCVRDNVNCTVEIKHPPRLTLKNRLNMFPYNPYEKNNPWDKSSN